MKIVRFLKGANVDDRYYARGDRHEFADGVADKLIADGVADLPVNPSILSEDAKAQYLADATPEPEKAEDEGKVMSTPRKKAKK